MSRCTSKSPGKLGKRNLNSPQVSPIKLIKTNSQRRVPPACNEANTVKENLDPQLKESTAVSLRIIPINKLQHVQRQSSTISKESPTAFPNVTITRRVFSQQLLDFYPVLSFRFLEQFKFELYRIKLFKLLNFIKKCFQALNLIESNSSTF